MENVVSPEASLKPIPENSFVDYTKRCSMSYFLDDGCKYCLSIIEEYAFRVNCLVPTGMNIVVVTGPRGTFLSKMWRKKDNSGWNAELRGFRELIGEKVYHFIEQKLHIGR